MKKILSFVMLLTTVFVLVGCGKNNKKTEEKKDYYKVLSIDELKAAPEVKVSFRIPFGTGIQDVINEMIEEFKVEYPNVIIELDVIGGYDEMKKATIYDINGGIAPTMTVGYPDHFAEYLITDSIIPLDGFIKSTDPVIGYTEAEINDFLPGYLEENRQFDKDKSFMGLPFNKSTEALFYNVDFFEQFGLTVPKTWAELETLTAQIKTIVAGLEDNQYAWLPTIKTDLAKDEFLPLMYDSTGNLFTTIIHQFGGKYTASLYRDNGVTDVQKGQLKFVDDAKAKEALTYMQSLANNKVLNIPDVWEGDFGSNFFINGQIVMNIGSTAGVSYYAASKSRWNAAPIPYKDADHKYVIQQGTNVAIFSQASDLEKLAAWLFIKHCLSPENTANFAMRTGYMPVRSSSYQLDEYKTFLQSPAPGDVPTSKVHNAAGQYSKDGWNYFVDAAWSGSSQVREEVGTAVVQILVNKADVQQAFTDAKNRYGK